MTRIIRTVYLAALSLAAVFFLMGCVQMLTVVSVPLTALQLGATAYQSIEQADINAAVVSDVSQRELRQIKRVAVFLGRENQEEPYGRIGDLGAVVGDNLCVQLSKRGFQVRDGSKVKRSIVAKLAGAGYTSPRIAAIGKALGVQAIVTGNVTAAQHKSYGVLGVGRMNTVVQSASMKIIGVKNRKTLMIVTINYKVGQNPNTAAEGIAIVLKEKLENPATEATPHVAKANNVPQDLHLM